MEHKVTTAKESSAVAPDETKKTVNEYAKILNDEQRIIFNAVLSANFGDILNIQGNAGTGKTTTIKAVLTEVGYDFNEYSDAKKQTVEITAYTGIAAHLYGNNAITLHQLLARYCDIHGIWDKCEPFQQWCCSEYPAITSKNSYMKYKIAANMLIRYFDVLFDDNAEDACQISSVQQQMLSTLKLVNLPEYIIVDESSMCPRMFARVLINHAEHTKLIFIGDRHQIPPVVSSGVEEISGMMYDELPSKTKYYQIKKVMRQRTEEMTETLTLLNSIIMNKTLNAAKQTDVYNLNVKLINGYNNKPPEVIIVATNNEKDQLNKAKTEKSQCVILHPEIVLKASVDIIRARVDWLDKGMRVIEDEHGGGLAKDSATEKEWAKTVIREHYIKTIRAAEVAIPTNARVLNLVNIRQQQKGDITTLCPNGAVGTLSQSDNKAQEYHPKIIMDDFTYKDASYKGLSLKFEEYIYTVKGKLEYFHASTKEYFGCVKPGIQMYFAITYHKVQGLTFDFPYEIRVNDFFLPRTPGLAYVAITRATDFSNIRLANKCLTPEMFDYPTTLMDNLE